MRRYHIIAVTPDFAQTLVTPTTAGWLLPWLDDNPRVALPTQIDQILRVLTTAWELVHEAPLPAVDGDSINHGYCLVVTSAPVISEHVAYVSNTELDDTPAIISLQRHAWRLALRRLQYPEADFDSRAQVDQAMGWAVQQIEERDHARVTSTSRHRCSRYEYVVRFDTTRQSMYFKGGAARVADEAVLTSLLHTPRESDVPETVAIDADQGRWLYRGLEGAPMVGAELTLASAVAVMPALAALQQRSISAPLVPTHLEARQVDARELFDVAGRLLDTVIAAALPSSRDGERMDRSLGAWQVNRHSLLERCAGIDELGLPSSLAMSDLWPRNVIVTSGNVGFIDLERCYWSYPFLSLWRFVRAVEASLRTGGLARAQIEAAFVSAWSNVVAPDDMRRGLAELPLLGQLFELALASSELDAREREMGTALPIKHRASALIPHVQPLLNHAVQNA